MSRKNTESKKYVNKKEYIHPHLYVICLFCMLPTSRNLWDMCSLKQKVNRVLLFQFKTITTYSSVNCSTPLLPKYVCVRGRGREYV